MNCLLMEKLELLTWFTLTQISGTILCIMINAWSLYAEEELFYWMM